MREEEREASWGCQMPETSSGEMKILKLYYFHFTINVCSTDVLCQYRREHNYIVTPQKVLASFCCKARAGQGSEKQ